MDVSASVETVTLKTVVLKLDEKSASGLLRYLYDGPAWEHNAGGDAAHAVANVLEVAGIREA